MSDFTIYMLLTIANTNSHKKVNLNYNHKIFNRLVTITLKLL